MSIQELENIKISRSNYHGVFIPAVFPRKNFINITQRLYNELRLKCEPSFFAIPYTMSTDKIIGCFASVSTERHLKQKDPNYDFLTHSQKEELEWDYSDKILIVCQEICDKYKINLLYKAHLLFPSQGKIFLNYEITPSEQ